MGMASIVRCWPTADKLLTRENVSLAIKVVFGESGTIARAAFHARLRRTSPMLT
jgi:hypothetical protein